MAQPQAQWPGQTPIVHVVEDNVVRMALDASVLDVAEMLTSANIGVVVLGDETTTEGIVSERDVVRAVAERRDPLATRAIDVGHRQLVWCDVSATVAEVADEMMEQYVRHVLVERDGVLVGVVSARDVLGVYASAEEVVA